MHKPLALGGKEYDFITIRNQDANRRTVLRFFQSSQPLYRRGAATLLKANIAWLYSDFREAACFYLWIALDAAFSIICNRLRADGNPNPTAHDAQDFIERLHGDNESSDRKFFEHDYYTRIEAMHPENRYSSVARPLILADDFLELNDSLTDLYYFFATGVVREHL